MKRFVLLLATVAAGLLSASGVALAVTTVGMGAPEEARGRDAALDASLKALLARHGGPLPG